ncbi:hypothetical protein PVAG01_06922 [Phlyctema vagabunda]|uniref:NmrA-like domain-containing protein n=1 Tax=Phlyctema vagabunda TaxID=108571 RepID=A0ABR4PI42_9HELO
MGNGKTIVVLGATGNQGGSVAKLFNKAGWSVRAITRNPSSESAKALVAQGIEVAAAELDSLPSLVSAFKGAHVIFGVTDFWAPYFARYGELSQVSDRATGEYATAIEIQRGKNIVDAAETVLKEEGLLERFIWSSLPSINKSSGGEYTYAYHYDGKALVQEYLQHEKKELWLRSSVLHMGFYATNLKTFGKVVGANQDESGTVVFSNPGGNDASHPFVVPSDTGKYVDLLVRTPPGNELLACSVETSYNTFMKTWSEVTGIPSRVEEITVDQADKAAPGGLGREVAESTAWGAKYGWGQREGKLVLPWQLDPQIELTSLREYFEVENWKEFA